MHDLAQASRILSSLSFNICETGLILLTLQDFSIHLPIYPLDKYSKECLGSGNAIAKKTDQRLALNGLLEEWEGSWRKGYVCYKKMRVK